MAVAAPPRLSGMTDLLLRRPPSLREQVVLVGNAEDHAWFVGLVRRLFPQEAEAVLTAPDVRQRVEGFARLFEERHYPLYAPFLRVLPNRGGRTSLHRAPQGHPLRAARHRVRGAARDVGRLPRGALGPGTAGQAPRILLHRVRRDQGGLGWSRPPPTSRSTRCSGYPKGGIPQDALTEAVKGTRFEGASQAASWVWAETGNFFLDNSYDDGTFDGFSDPWEDELIAEGTEEWRKGQGRYGRGEPIGRLAGGRPARPLRRDAGLYPGAARKHKPNCGGNRP